MAASPPKAGHDTSPKRNVAEVASPEPRVRKGARIGSFSSGSEGDASPNSEGYRQCLQGSTGAMLKSPVMRPAEAPEIPDISITAEANPTGTSASRRAEL